MGWLWRDDVLVREAMEIAILRGLKPCFPFLDCTSNLNGWNEADGWHFTLCNS